jgi:probable phosphoglycerate mutase
VAARALAALAELPPSPVTVVVTHGGTAGRLMERLLLLGPEHRRVFGPLGNCAWTELAHQGDRWRVMLHNSAVSRRTGARDAVTAASAPAGDADAVA